MTDIEIFKILRPHIMRVTGVSECIFADPNAPAPANIEYCAVRPRQSVSERGQANIYTSDLPDDRIRTEVRSQIVASCQINFYRGEALRRAELLKECHKLPSVTWDLFKHGIGWGGTQPVNNLTALQASKFEQRAEITIRLMYETVNIDDVNNILSASAIVEDEKARLLQTVDVNLR